MTDAERQADHDCIDWNSGGACAICHRSLSIEEQQETRSRQWADPTPELEALRETLAENAQLKKRAETAEAALQALTAKLRGLEQKWRLDAEYEPGWCPYCGEPEELCRASHPNGTCQPGAAGQE